ncbi:hypothetical protein B484DRAFT_60575 [Ochromonadaceae sp. CCMP2298]|nr:hypothetical protein B484DRAFT_60575 [Ochromonadaceae sp. CCMP2298]
MLRNFNHLLILSSCYAIALSFWTRTNIPARSPLVRFAYLPSTYTAAEIPSSKVQLLVKDGEQAILDTIECWSTGKLEVEDDEIVRWIDKGLAFWMNPEGTRSIHISEVKEKPPATAMLDRRPKSAWLAADVYVNCGTDSAPLYVDAAKFESLKNGGKGVEAEQLIESGDAHRNLEHLFVSEQVLSRADSIATRLKEEFGVASPEWARWTNKTSTYNATSLTQIMGEYFATQSIGDVGGADVNYEPRPGYSGTLAPGMHFQDNYPIEELPNRILHPWPSMQQFQFHVRWPPSHPMIPPPVLWLGINDMYTENFTATQLAAPSHEIVGGLLMEPKDAMRIAKYGDFGRSYEPDHQIKHGGMIFDAAYKIPGYNPDHGPTVSDEEARVPVPERLLPITETWLDPYYGLETASAKVELEADQMADAEAEEEARRQKVQKLLLQGQLSNPDKSDKGLGQRPLWSVLAEAEGSAMENEIDRRMAMQKEAWEKQLEDMEDDETVSTEEEGAPAVRDDRRPTTFLNLNLNVKQFAVADVPYSAETELSQRTKFRQEIVTAQNLADVAAGK